MKKILLIDSSLDGHHKQYLNAVASINNLNFVIVVPNCNFESSLNVIYTKQYDLKKFYQYIKWLNEVLYIVKKEKPDIIHFLYGDVFYRFFGFGLNKFKKKCKKVIVTFHQFRIRNLVKISLKRIFKNINFGVIHTEYNLEELKQIGIKNICMIDYPQLYDFNYNSTNCNTFISELNINKGTKILSLLGGLQDYKGLDILINALKKVKCDNYKIIIAGKLYNYTIEEINSMIEPVKDKIIFIPGFIPDEVFIQYIYCSDYILLPYKKSFDGASGPLTEAVWARKPVIASNIKSLGHIIHKYNLGFIFECENSDELAEIIKLAINSSFKWNDKAEEFRNKIKLKTFLNRVKNLYNEE